MPAAPWAPLVGRAQWPFRTALICGVASLLHLAAGFWPSMNITFALPCFGAVIATIVVGSTLGSTFRFFYLVAGGIVFGALISTATLAFVGRSDGGILGALFLQVFLVICPESASPDKAALHPHAHA